MPEASAAILACGETLLTGPEVQHGEVLRRGLEGAAPEQALVEDGHAACDLVNREAKGGESDPCGTPARTSDLKPP